MRFRVWMTAVLVSACAGSRSEQAPADARLAEFRSLRDADVHAARDIARTPTAGTPSAGTFDETDPDSALVGLRCAYGDYSGYRVLTSVTPVFRSERGHDRDGTSHGTGGSDAEAPARPGYAVGGLRVRAGDMIDARSVVFFRDLGARLAPDDAYASPWIGGDGGGRTIALGGDGRRVVGVHGEVAEGWLQTIGLVVR